MIHVEFYVAVQTLQAVGTVLALLLALLLAVLVRRRRRKGRLMGAMADIRSDFLMEGEHPVIEEFRREMDASYRKHQRRLLAEDWERDGRIMLEKRKAT